jgi:hypothetical protein
MLRFLAIVALLPACLPELPSDLPPPEPQPEPPPPEPPPTDVTVRVSASGAPVSGLAVVFQGPDGATLADLVTDGSGAATTAMPSGGSVTVIRRIVEANETRSIAYTLAGVKPGEQLAVRAPGTETTPSMVTLPSAQDAYSIATPCSTTSGIGPEVPISLGGCGTETDLFVIDSNGNTFLARRPVAPVIDLSAETARANQTATLIATNVPANVSLALEKRVLSGTATLFATGAVQTQGSVPGQESVNIPVPNLGAAVADQQVVVDLIDALGRTQIVASRAAYANTPGTVDVASAIAFVDAPTFTANTLSWTASTTASADFVIATLVDGSATRVIAAPFTGTSVTVAPLPASHLVNVGDNATAAHSVVEVTGGYDGVRASLFTVAEIAGLAPASGTIAIASSGGPAGPIE